MNERQLADIDAEEIERSRREVAVGCLECDRDRVERGRTTAAALAIELEVSERTIYRDVRELQAAGVPVWTETGPGGGIELLDTWTSRLEALTGDEAARSCLRAHRRPSTSSASVPSRRLHSRS